MTTEPTTCTGYPEECTCPECLDWQAELREAECRAEFAMSWVMGGGRPEDTSAAYYQWEHA